MSQGEKRGGRSRSSTSATPMSRRMRLVMCRSELPLRFRWKATASSASPVPHTPNCSHSSSRTCGKGFTTNDCSLGIAFHARCKTAVGSSDRMKMKRTQIQARAKARTELTSQLEKIRRNGWYNEPKGSNHGPRHRCGHGRCQGNQSTGSACKHISNSHVTPPVGLKCGQGGELHNVFAAARPQFGIADIRRKLWHQGNTHLKASMSVHPAGWRDGSGDR